MPFQLGFPTLPESGSETHFAIIRQWLETCNDLHPGCRYRPKETSSPPTRLIDVGGNDSPRIHLVETKDGEIPWVDCPRYIALSHRWGAPPHFCTDGDPAAPNSLSKHMSGIRVSDLPATFRDAVRTTRALGVRYLWIDSICILQGRNGDFIKEARGMENVFSSAYCVLAASCVSSQRGGFLGYRRNRKVVTIQQEKDPLYICEMIDNFDEHVLKSELNNRGWVLQERALARRTIFFTERQTYWECGHGVRCETMTKMNK
jgi:hypothetical protein